MLFGLPGAFTPTCHKNHLPGFIVNEAAFKGKGVDKIAMTSVNDHFVLGAWSEATGAKGHIDFLADGSADFAKALGLELDASAGGLGMRSKRYSMLVVDGVVKELNIEPEPGKADVSGAEHLLGGKSVSGTRGLGGGGTSRRTSSCLTAFVFSSPWRWRWQQARRSPKPSRSGPRSRSASRRAALVQAIHVADGAHVDAGQVLVELDCEPLTKEVDVRTANLGAAEANYERVVNGPRPEEIAIGEAGVGVAVARADEARAALDRAHAMEVGVSITLAQLLVVERDSRVADAAGRRAQEARAAQGRLALRGHRRGQGPARQRGGLARRGQGRTRSVLGQGARGRDGQDSWSPSASSSRPTRQRRSFS